MKSLLSRISDFFDRHILISNLTLVIIAGSATCFIFSSFNKSFVVSLPFSPLLFMQGEYWRILTFLFYPIDTNLFFAFFAYYFYYFMGTALEQEWGAGKYTRYIGLSALVCLGIAFFFPDCFLTNGFITYSIFWAFAFLFPEFQVYLFFVIPVKVKHIGWFSWGLCVISLFIADISQKIEISASMITFGLFFFPQIYSKIIGKPIPQKAEMIIVKVRPPAFHRCEQCGVDENTAPQAEFRVCSTCKKEFCMDHLKTHKH